MESRRTNCSGMVMVNAISLHFHPPHFSFSVCILCMCMCALQRLVMSKAVPLDKLCRLGTTRYSKLRKDATLPKMRYMHARMYFQGFSVFNRTQLCRAKANNILLPGRCLDVGQHLPCPFFDVVCEVFSIFFGMCVWAYPWRV
jgi:hypothetical protein